MNVLMKNIYLASVLSLLSFTAYAAGGDAAAPSITGNYECQRTDTSSNTSSYSLSVTKNGDGYTFEWDNANGYPYLYGTGLMHPDKNNLVGVSFTDPKDNTNYGAEMIEIKSDGSLQANWVIQSANQVGSETCTKSK